MIDFENNFSLKSYNTFGLESYAKFFSIAYTIEDIFELLASRVAQSHAKLILGGGSNLLLTQNVDGLVIKNSINGIEKIKEDDLYVYLKVGAGVVWHDFVMYCVDNDLAGVENLALIPGTVGAAPMQNIGAYGVEIKDVFESLEAVYIEDYTVHNFSKADCKFGYRESIFKNKYKGQFIITSVVFKLSKRPTFQTSYGAIEQTLQQMGVDKLSVRAISDAVISIRKSKLPDPKILGNSGSFFKNPEISLIKLNELKNIFPEIPHYPMSADTCKLAAGWMIEKCGWKGKRIGNTGAHKDQALVLVNYGSATGEEIWQLAKNIKQSVFDTFGVEIVPEVNII